MDAEETIALFEKGMTAWNAWAEEMMRTEPSSSSTTSKVIQGERQKWERQATVHFRDYTFERRAYLDGWKFPHNVYFKNVFFQDGLWLKKNDFPGNVEITSSTIDGEADFTAATFHQNLTISANTTFSADATFAEMEVLGEFIISHLTCSPEMSAF